jgi:hypothetical protein
MDVKGLIADQMGNFTPYQIAGVLLSVVLAALLAYATVLIVGGQGGGQARSLGVTAAIVAFAVALVKASLPLSIALVAVALLLRGSLSGDDRGGMLLRLAVVAIGVGCGASAGIIVLAAFLPVALLLRWALSVK